VPDFCAPARMKSSRLILRRLVRNIAEMYIAKRVGEADSFPLNLSSK